MTKHSPDTPVERLLELSDEVRQIAGSLADFPPAQGQAGEGAFLPECLAGEVPEKTVRWLIRARRERASYFAGDLFADPAWDIMLDLFQAELTGRRATVGSVSAAANVPSTTALRWLKSLEDQNLIIRSTDPHDRRRVFIELAPQASNALRRWFADSFARPK